MNSIRPRNLYVNAPSELRCKLYASAPNSFLSAACELPFGVHDEISVRRVQCQNYQTVTCGTILQWRKTQDWKTRGGKRGNTKCINLMTKIMSNE